MIAPPTPTTTPITVLRVWGDIPEPPLPLLLLFASPGVAVVTTSEVRVSLVPSLLVTVSIEVIVLITGFDGSWLGSLGGGVVSWEGGWVELLVLVLGLSDEGFGGVDVVVLDDVVSGGGVDGSEGFGGWELGCGGGVELGIAEGVGVLVSEPVALGVGRSSTTSCRCCITLTFRASTLPLAKVASATERAESPITRKSRNRLVCILVGYLKSRGSCVMRSLAPVLCDASSRWERHWI